ncbi:hypothetical protein [Streptomyces sp. NPDC090026]|uniref:hypothetical protein n=1 Tax=Streptomyces sp. NPDC090026 TaxID=3365923 RepID=UPI00382FBB11
MGFPDEPLDVRTELQIGGVWTDVSTDVYTRSPITIERGRRDEGTRTDPTRVSLQLNNKLGKYSPRNPMSPYYGLIGRNTPLRVSLPGPATYLSLPGGPDRISTPDTAALDITGDLDVRVDITLDEWGHGTTHNVIGKYIRDGDRRSWRLVVGFGRIYFGWSTDGTLPGFLQQISDYLPTRPSGRLALRVTLDVDNGAGGHTVTFYTAPTLAGPWTQHGEPFTAAGTTSIHSGTAPLDIGHVDGNPVPIVFSYPVGRLHAAEVRSGIDGTVVAAPDLTDQTVGATSFVDSAGRTWTVYGDAEISDREYRAHAEVSSWPPRWDVSGQDRWVPIEAAGVQRRLGQGKKALQSTLRRRIPSGAPLAYWPMEDGRDADRAYSPVEGVRPLTISGLDLAADDTIAGSSALPTLGASASLSGIIPRSVASGWHVEFVYYLPEMPASQTEIVRVRVAGSAMATAVVYASTAGIRVEARDADDVPFAWFTYTNPDAITDFWGKRNRLAVFTSDSGGGITRLVANWRDLSNLGGRWTSATVFTGTMGAAVGVTGSWGAATEGTTVGHLAAFDVAGVADDPSITVYDGADDGFDGEQVHDRLGRLADEEAGTLSLVRTIGDLSRPSSAMGPQRPGLLMTLLEDGADADGGILYERADRLALQYRDRASLYNQPVRLALDYTEPGEVAPPLEPVEDDQSLRNDVSIERVGGSTGRAVRETGPLSVQPPPDGVGPYDQSLTLNLYSDAQTDQVAAWRMHLGTWDAARYPTVHVMLHRAPHLIPDVLAMTIGDRLTMANPPADVPPETIDQHALGYTEVLDLYTWDVFFNCAPAGPWQVVEVEAGERSRIDTAGSELAASIDENDTSLSLATTAGRLWTTDSGDLPLDIVVGGERMTITALSGSTSPQPATVTRSVNGVVKPHAAGSPVALADPVYIPL